MMIFRLDSASKTCGRCVPLDSLQGTSANVIDSLMSVVSINV